MKRLLPLLVMALLVGACSSPTPSETPATESPVVEVSPTPTGEPIAVADGTPIFLASWWSDSSWDEYGSRGYLPEVVSDGQLLYFLGSLAAPTANESIPDASTYRLFVYDPSNGTMVSTQVDTKILFGLGTPTVSDGAVTTATKGACVTAIEPSDAESFYDYVEGLQDKIGYSSQFGPLPETLLGYRDGQVGPSDAFCTVYSEGYNTRLAWTGDSDVQGERLFWLIDYDAETAEGGVLRYRPYLPPAGAWDDLRSTANRPTVACPPDETSCKKSDRLGENGILSASIYGPISVAGDATASSIAIYAQQPLYSDDAVAGGPLPLDELRYYDQATGTTGSILLNGKPLAGRAGMAFLIGGAIYLWAEPYVSNDGRFPGSIVPAAVLVRIDPANPGVATAITVAP